MFECRFAGRCSLLACETVGPVLEVRVPGSRTPWSGLSKCSSLVLTSEHCMCDLCREVESSVLCELCGRGAFTRAGAFGPLRGFACVCRSELTF
jgi:hypothetical protein